MTKLPFALATIAMLVFPAAATAEDVPDALSVEWRERSHARNFTKTTRYAFCVARSRPEGSMYVTSIRPTLSMH